MANPPINDIPPVYPKHSTTSDMPEPTAAVAAAEPVIGGESTADDAAKSDASTETVTTADDAKQPSPTAAKRGRPSRADRELAELRTQIAALTAAVSAKPVAEAPKPTETIPADPPRPKRADFADPDAYDEAVDTWRDKRDDLRTARREAASEVARAAKEAEDKRAQTEQAGAAEVEQEWQNGLVAARAKYPDFDEVAFDTAVTYMPAVFNSIVQSEVGAEIAYYLASHDDEREAMNAIKSPIKQALAVGKLEAKIEAEMAKAVKPAVAVADEPTRMTQPAAQTLPRPLRPVRPQSAPIEQPADVSSEDRIARRVAELQKDNRQIGWSQPAGRA